VVTEDWPETDKIVTNEKMRKIEIPLSKTNLLFKIDGSIRFMCKFKKRHSGQTREPPAIWFDTSR
jgi:hypothetical protein